MLRPVAVILAVLTLGVGCRPSQPTAPPDTDPVAFTADADVHYFDGGDERSIESVLVPGKITVVDFYADWCKPCVQIDAHMARVMRGTPGIALRKLDVVDWDSPLAKQHLQNVPNLPYVIVFGPSGKKVDAISGLDLDRLDQALARARGG